MSHYQIGLVGRTIYILTKKKIFRTEIQTAFTALVCLVRTSFKDPSARVLSVCAPPRVIGPPQRDVRAAAQLTAHDDVRLYRPSSAAPIRVLL